MSGSSRASAPRGGNFASVDFTLVSAGPGIPTWCCCMDRRKSAEPIAACRRLKGRVDAPWQGGALQAQRLSMPDVLPIPFSAFRSPHSGKPLRQGQKKARYLRSQVRQGRGGVSASYFRPGARRSRWQQRLPGDMRPQMFRINLTKRSFEVWLATRESQ